MTWIIYSLLGPFFWACSNFVDKYLLGKYTKGIYDFLFFSSITGWLFFLIILPFVGLPPLNTYFFIPVLTGMMLIYSYGFYGKALEKGDTSTLVILFLLIPVVTLVLGYFFLNQSVTVPQLWAFLIVIAGALIISFEKTGNFSTKGLGMISIAIIMWSVMTLLIDYGLAGMSFWQYFMLDNLGTAIGGVMLFAVAPIRREVIIGIRSANISKYVWFTFNNFLDFSGQMLIKLALTVSVSAGLVMAIAQVQSFYAILIGLILTLLIPSIIKEDISKQTLLKKFFGALVMFIGVSILFLG